MTCNNISRRSDIQGTLLVTLDGKFVSKLVAVPSHLN